MTADEAGAVMKIATAGAVARELEQVRYEFLLAHLLPLPYGRTLDSVHRYVANHKWVSSLEELLDACGLPLDDARAGATARTDLVRAVRDGGRLVRDLRAVSGWAYVGPGDPLPAGAVEAERLAAEPSRPALGAAVPLGDEERSDNLRRVGDLARLMGRRKAVESVPRLRPVVAPEVVEADLRAFEERRRAIERGAS